MCGVWVIHLHHRIRNVNLCAETGLVCLHTGIKLLLLSYNKSREHKNETYIHWELGPSPPWLIDMILKDSAIVCYFVWKWGIWGGDMVVIGEVDLLVAKLQSKFIP